MKPDFNLYQSLESLSIIPSSSSNNLSPSRHDFTFDGHHCSYLAIGSGPKTIILIHGFGANAETWRAIWTPLAAEGYRVIAMDLLGYGESEKPKDKQMSMD